MKNNFSICTIFYDGCRLGILYPLSDRNEFRLIVCLTPSNDQGEFELNLARCNKNIADNSFALGYEMDSRFFSPSSRLLKENFGRNMKFRISE